MEVGMRPYDVQQKHKQDAGGYQINWRGVFGPNPFFGMYDKTLKKGGGGFGHIWDMEPGWIHRYEHNNTRFGLDRLDWFFRIFNSTRLYETWFKTQPMYTSFIVLMAIFGA